MADRDQGYEATRPDHWEFGSTAGEHGTSHDDFDPGQGGATAPAPPERPAPAARGERAAPAKGDKEVGDQARESDAKQSGKDEGDEDKKRTDRRQEEQRRKTRPYVRIGLILVVLLLIVGGAYYWWSNRNLEDTDDAYTDGRAVTIAPHVSGYVVSLDVNDNEFVHKGQALIHIDPRDYIAARDRAQANLETALGELAAQQHAVEVAKVTFPARLAQARAQLDVAKAAQFKAQTDYNRQHRIDRAATTQEAVDTSTAALGQANAQVEQAEAAVEQATPVRPNVEQQGSRVDQLQGAVDQARAALATAELNLGWTVVTAPQDGWVTRRNVEQGNYVQQSQQIMSVVSPDVWITANFKETQLAHMRPGQQVNISVDAYPSLKLHGHVDSVQLGSGSKFTAFPPENATGNFVKIVQRVPVKILIDSGIDPNVPLPLGISVEPTVSLK